MRDVAAFLSALLLPVLADVGPVCSKPPLQSLSPDHVMLALRSTIQSSDPGRAAAKLFLTTRCEADVSLRDVDEGIDLARQFLLNSQTAAGNFHYEYDFRRRKESRKDLAARQTGTLWGVALLHSQSPKPSTLQVLRKGFAYFAKHSEELDSGIRLLSYPQGPNGAKLTTTALLAMAHVETLRFSPQLEATEAARLGQHLEGYMKAILHARYPDQSLAASYSVKGLPTQNSSNAFSDGEGLLACILAAKYLNRSDLWEVIEPMADAGWHRWVESNLESKEPAVNELHGYFHWSLLAYMELLSSTKVKRFERFAGRAHRFSSWILKKLEKGSHGNGATFEGLVPSLLIHARHFKSADASGLVCAIKRGLSYLFSQQVGHSRSGGMAKMGPAGLPRARGGILRSPALPKLRIDDVQHALHGVLMARQLLTEDPT